jgi:hypothetical protein
VSWPGPRDQGVAAGTAEREVVAAAAVEPVVAAAARQAVAVIVSHRRVRPAGQPDVLDVGRDRREVDAGHNGVDAAGHVLDHHVTGACR